MCCQTVFILFTFLLISNSVTALTLSPCVKDGNVRVAEVERGKNSSFTCRGFRAGDTVQWRYQSDSTGDLSAGACPPLPNNKPGGCQAGILGSAFTAIRKSATESVMTVDPTQTQGETLVRQGTLTCKDNTDTDTCQMDLITPAVVSTCSVKFERVNDVWLTTGRCDITSANSTEGRYRCRLYRKKGSSVEEDTKAVASYTPPSGVCNFTESLPTADGEYTYRVKVIPGEVFKQASFIGSNQIKHPTAPTMPGCSTDDYIAENKNVSCTCSTVNVGQPAGRLVWYRAGVAVTYGNYGDDTLTVSQNLTRTDHDVTEFRCAVDWAANVQGDSRTFKVGYKPERLSFALGPESQTEVTVKENNTVTFTCGADSRPVASITVVKQGGTEIRSGQSPLTFPLTASCTDTGTYLCSASNDIGQADTSVSSKLYVACKPRIAQTDLALELNYKNQSQSSDFDVIAYPTLNATFSRFKYLGPKGTDPSSNTSNIRLNTTCQHETGDASYTSTCTLTVHDMTSPAAEGVYTVTLFNTEGSHDVRFKVLYNAPVPASDNAAPTGNGAVIGGSVAAVIVVVAIVVIVVFVMKRRKGHPKERLKSSTNAADSTRNGQGMEESGLAGGDQEATSRPLSFAPMAVYAEVDRKKKKSQAAAAPEAEANGGKPADVYAEVNKPKQFIQGAAAKETEVNGGQSADVYADVDKTKKKQASGSGAKPKTGAKAAGKPKKDKKNNANRDESAHLYGNVGEITQGKGAKAKKTSKPPKEETSSGKMVTPEGLIYTAVEFSQPPKFGKPAPKKPEEEPVVYSAVDFKKSPPAP